jgi:hypothetical protein
LHRFLLLAAALSLCCRCASAQTQLTLVMQVDTDPSGIVLSGSGTSTASLNFGTVRAFGGTVPSGVTESLGVNSWTLNTMIDVEVSKGSLDVLDALSTSYTLTAQLRTADTVNTWKWNSLTLSTTAGTITATGVYSSTPRYTFNLTVPFSESAGTIANTIEMTATAN